MVTKVDFTNDKIINGINAVADAVKTTMGAKGQTVIFGRQFGDPVATKDGANVAKQIVLEDPAENIGAQMIQEVSQKMADEVGDGTTAATVLTQALIKGGKKAQVAGANSIKLKRGMQLAVKNAIDAIDSMATPVKSDKEIEQIATISANGDAELGAQIAKANKEVGKDGVITVEVGNGTETDVAVVNGMQFDQGFISPYFVTNTKKTLCEMENVRIFVSEKRITSLQCLLPILEPVAQSGLSLLIIAEDIDSEAVATLVLNRVRGGLKVCAVKADGFGETRKETLKDIAAMTGATVITDDMGMGFENLTMDCLGTAKKISVGRSHTTLIGIQGNEEIDAAVETRVQEIRSELEKETTAYRTEQLKKRLAKLTGGMAVIRVGGLTEADVNEKKDRVDDAVAATRAAIETGIVAGGGLTLAKIAKKLCESGPSDPDELMGYHVVLDALLAPMKQIVENAGVNSEVVFTEIDRISKEHVGFDVCTGEYVDMYESGIVDPAKVVRESLKKAITCALTVLTSGCVISQTPNPDDANRQILH